MFPETNETGQAEPVHFFEKMLVKCMAVTDTHLLIGTRKTKQSSNKKKNRMVSILPETIGIRREDLTMTK
jgi:hypothetical protein